MEYYNYLFGNIHKLHPEAKKFLPVQVQGAGFEKVGYSGYFWDNKSLREDKNYLLFQYTLDGNGRFEWTRNGQTQKQLQARNSMFVVTSEMEYSYRYDPSDPPWVFYWIMFSGPFARSIYRMIRKTGPLFEFGDDDGLIRLLTGFLTRLNSRSFIDTYSLSAFGYEFLAQFYKHLSRGAPGVNTGSAYDFIYQVQSFIRTNLDRIDLELLAEHFKYNKIYFNSYFKRRTGTTPHQYILAYKIKYASFLLSATQRKIRIVARESGFENENYFSKVFKKHTSRTPEQYRKENTANYSSEEFIIL